jgi:hypothetical protein
MDLILTRGSFRPDGIFGSLETAEGFSLAYTLEHSYPAEAGKWVAKVAPGLYSCVRHPPNRLPYETFLLEKVPPFQGKPVEGILLHKGNFDKDSEGCILLGTGRSMTASGLIIVQSKEAFDKFMALQARLPGFQLLIREEN